MGLIDSFLDFVIVVLLGVGFSLAARRTLSAPVGKPRSILVGILLFTSIGGVTPWILEQTGIDSSTATTVNEAIVAVSMLALILAWGFFASIAVLVVLELIIPTGSLGTPWGLVRSIRSRNRRTRRYLEVLAIATKHGLGGFLSSSTGRVGRDSGTAANTSATARALRGALNEGGVTFIKVGQMLSSRPDLVGPVFATELSHLQAASTPLPWSQLEPVLAGSQARPLAEIFAEIDPEPLATASVAQVHTAVLTTGESVVVKIQKPKAQAQVTADLDIMLRLARRLDKATEWGRSLGVVKMAEGFAASLDEELDYRIEADNTQSVAAAAGPDSPLKIPHVYDEFSSATVLVIERLNGTPLGKSQHRINTFTVERRRQLADDLLGGVLQQVMIGGVFHADLHPGNVLVTADGELQLLDFGSVGRLDDVAREALTTLVLAIDRGSSTSATDALMALMDPPEATIDERLLEREVGQLLVRYRGGSRSSGSMFGALFGLVNKWGFGVPAQVAAVFRTFASLEGTLRLLDPELNLVVASRKHGEALFAESMRPSSIRQQVESELMAVLPMLRRLPRRLDRISGDLEQGRTTVSLRFLAHGDDRHFLLGLTHQLVVAVLASSATLAAVALIIAPGGPMLTPTVGFYDLLGFGLLFVASMLTLRTLVVVFRRSWST